MTGAGSLLYAASLVTFTFGGLMFSALALFYWRQRRSHKGSARNALLSALTLLCAVSFIANLLLRMTGSVSLEVVLYTATGAIPAVLLHLVYSAHHTPARTRAFWRSALPLFYTACAAAAVAVVLDTFDLLPGDWSDSTADLPAWLLGAAGTLSVAISATSGRTTRPGLRVWTVVAMTALAACSFGSVAQVHPIVGVLPDYLLLAMFGALLYYTEPLVFFDVLLKRGAYLAVALIALAAIYAAGTTYILVLLPLWIVSPWLYRLISNAIDRVWLRRRYLPAEAERMFIESVQTAATQDELRARADASLAQIFEAPVQVRFDGTEAGSVLAVSLEGGGSIALGERASGIPYMSDDEHLLQSLARTLSVVRENVGFRQQQIEHQERERQLQWLASRAELKALRAQINPHFLFNALNAIAGLICERPQEADETVEQLAQVFRYTLRKADNEWVRLEEELEFISAYLRVERARFGDRLRVAIAIDPAARSIPVPAMSVQPLVENAIKHGVSEVEGQGVVRIEAAIRGATLDIVVTDNGPGFRSNVALHGREPDADGGHGLRNISERLRAYYGSDARLSWDRDGEETRVTIAIPTGRSADAGSGS